eukprot:scaffold14602_cov118-Isochrysis_galbana.AAC.10
MATFAGWSMTDTAPLLNMTCFPCMCCCTLLAAQASAAGSRGTACQCTDVVIGESIEEESW